MENAYLKMRRKNKEITDPEIIEEIIRQSDVCRIALHDDEFPYIVPLNYAYEDGTLYFHSANEGKKIELIRKNNKVCFEIECESEIIRHEVPCKWSTKYRSIIGFGRIEFIPDMEGKQKGLDLIMAHYGRPEENRYNDTAVKNIAVMKLIIQYLSAKQSGDWETE